MISANKSSAPNHITNNHNHYIKRQPKTTMSHPSRWQNPTPLTVLLCSTLIALTSCGQLIRSTAGLSDRRSGGDQASSQLQQSSRCPNKWVELNGRCLKIFNTPRSRGNAESKCKDSQSHLLFVEDDPNNKDRESYEEPGSNILSQMLTANNETKVQIQTFRQYNIDLSSDLLKQYKERQQQQNGGYNSDSGGSPSDTSEHMDIELSLSDFWLSRDDPSLADVIYNSTDPQFKDLPPVYALAFSKHHKRWVIIPVKPTTKLAFICERAANDSREHQQSASNGAPESSSEPKQDSTIQPGPGLVISTQTTSSTPNQRSREESEVAVSVAPPPQIEVSSVLFRESPQNQSVVLGSTAEMRCSPIDSKSTQIIWIFNGRNLTQTNRIKFQSTGILRIEHVRNTDDGNYTCSLSANGMIESKSARLEIIERPHQAEYITAELLDRLSTSVRIKWTPGFNGNSPIIKYQVEMRTVNTDNIDSELSQIMHSKEWEVAKANISADQTSVIIPDLKPAKKYIFRIRAFNRVGTGDASTPTKPPIEVPTQPPSMPPENLTGVSKSSTSISIQWSPPPVDSQNGAIKAYKVRHKLAGYETTSEWYTSEVPESAPLSFVLDDLIVWQEYEIQVAAENDKGVGPFSQSIRVRTKEGKPDKGPQNVKLEALTPTMIKVTWNPPPPQHINGFNLGYKVQVWSDGRQPQLVKEKTIPHSSVSPLHAINIDDLQPYTKYNVTVKCYTVSGDGPANEDPVSVRTREDFPEAVASLEFQEVLDKSLRLVWKQPNRVNGELTYYTLEYSEAHPNARKITRKYPADATEARIVDLTPQTSYVFKLYSNTNVGQGPPKSANITTTVPPVLPEPPTDLVISNIGARTATIHFNPGFDGNAKIEKWIIEALTPSTSIASWQRIHVSTNHTHDTVLVRNLKPFTRYKIRLIPVNIVGESQTFSAPTNEFQTSQIAPERAPADLLIEDAKEKSVLARWSALRESEWLGEPIGYNITWTEVGNSTASYFLVKDATADSFLVHDLEEFTEYLFRVYALNRAGSSPPSEPALATTPEAKPSAGPSDLTAHAISSNAISVDWNPVPKRHRNGVIRGYKIQYQPVDSNLPAQHKVIEDNSTKHVTLNDLKPFCMYELAVAAYTAAGDGVYSHVLTAQTLEDRPGAPQNLTIPTVSQTTARIIWDAPDNPNGNITNYRISYHLLTDPNKEYAHELHENERTFKVTNLKPDSHYVFTVTAKTKEGWGQPAKMVMLTHDSELRANPPFYKESWFVILCASMSVVITIIVTALLFIQTKSYKYKQDAIKSTSQDRLGDAGFTIDDEPGNHYNNGFGLLSQGPSGNHRRSNGALSQSTANFTLPKTPPRPQPGSVVYSDEGDDDVFEDIVDKPMKSSSRPGTSNYDSSGDSLTEKPSEISSSPAPESDSADEEYANMADRQYMNHYANVNGTMRSQKSWKKGPKHYSSYRTKPKLPQRPVPSVPQVPGSVANDPSSSSSENTSQGMRPGTSGMQSIYNNGSNSIYGESSSKDNSQQLQPPQPSFRAAQTTNNNSQPQFVPNSDPNNNNIDSTDGRPNTQTMTDMLNGHIVNLNGGRIIVDNMAGSRAPLPGFTSFV